MPLNKHRTNKITKEMQNSLTLLISIPLMTNKTKERKQILFNGNGFFQFE